MSLGKQRGLVLIAGCAVLGMAALGVVGSVAPMGGATWPHLLAAKSGLPFRLAALLVSLVSAMLGVLALFVLSFYPRGKSDE